MIQTLKKNVHCNIFDSNETKNRPNFHRRSLGGNLKTIFYLIYFLLLMMKQIQFQILDRERY